MADLSAYLSPADRAKLARQVGITLDDGRVFRNGVIVSAQDAANTAAKRARDAAFASQTGQYADRSGTVNPNDAGRAAYGAYLGSFGAPGQAAQAPQAAQMAQAGPAGQNQAGPAQDLLNRARLMAQYQGAQGAQPTMPMQPTGISVAAGPSISTAPTGLPQGSIGFARAGGGYTVQAPMGPGMGTQTFGSEQQAMQAFAGQAPMPSFLAPQATGPVNAPAPMPAAMSKSAAPALPFLPGGGGYSPDQINRMSPDQRSALVSFNTEQAAAQARPPELSVGSVEEAAQRYGSGYDYTLKPRQGGGFTIEGLSPRATATRDVLTPQEAGATEAQKGLIGRINKQVEEESAYASSAQQTLEEIAATRQALASGGMTGTGQVAADAALGALSRLPGGVGQYFEGLKGNQDVLRRGFASFAVEAAQRIAGQGQVTEKERELVAATVPQLGNTPASVRFGVDFMEATIQRRQKYANLLEETQARLAAGEISATEASKLTNKTKFMQENPIDVTALYDRAIKPASGSAASTPAPAAGGAPATSPDIEAILNKYR